MSRRILFFMSTGSAVGGVETWLDRICTGIAQNGYEPTIALAAGLKTNDPERFRRFHPHLQTVTVDGRGLPAESRILACLRAIRQIKPCVVVPHPLIDAIRACARAKTSDSHLRVIAVTHGLLPPMLADLEELRPVFDMAVCPGRLNARYLTDVAGFERGRVRNVRAAADSPARSRIPRRPDEPLRLAYVGRLSEVDKRAPDLVPLYEQLTARGVRFRLTIVGDGPCRGSIEEQLRGRPEVTFTGPLPHAEVYERIYPQTDCLLSFSSSESFGISVVEAMMNGVVPVTSQFLGLRSEGAVVHSQTGIVFPIGDVAAAADGIAQLDADAELQRRISDAAAATAAGRYSWRACIEGWRQCVEDVQTLPQSAAEDVGSAANGRTAGRLDRLRLPTGLVDGLRRIRRRIAPTVIAGGEEWPIFQRHHSQQRLARIAQACAQLDGEVNQSSAEPRDVMCVGPAAQA